MWWKVIYGNLLPFDVACIQAAEEKDLKVNFKKITSPELRLIFTVIHMGEKIVKIVKLSKLEVQSVCFSSNLTKYTTISISVMQRAGKSFSADLHRCRENPVCLAHSLRVTLLTGTRAMCQVATWRKNHRRICKYMSKLCLCFSCTSKCPGFVWEAASLKCPYPT